MATPNPSRPHAAWLLLVLAVAGIACGPRPPTQAAVFDSTRVDTASVATITTYGTKLGYDSVLGAADVQPLLVRDRYRYGFAKIEPETGAYRLDTNVLARGRIIARISSESAYAPLGLGPGINWWWIDRKGGKWRSIVYTEARNTKLVTILDSLRSHPNYRFRQSIARFVFIDSVVAMWYYSDSKCLPVREMPAWYSALERAQPWPTRGPTR